MDLNKSDHQNLFTIKRNLPNSTPVLVLGIVSIVTCCCYGIPGLVCGIVALVLAKKDNNLYLQNPDSFYPSSLKNLNAGKICAIIGICFSAIYIAVFIFYFATMGTSINPSNWRDFIPKQ